jgi:hypothetical protein
MSKEIMQQALTVLKAWDALIKYQYGGSNEAMTAMQNVAWRTLDTIEGLEQELAKPEQTALDKKADNARELGLDYEPEQEPAAWISDSPTKGNGKQLHFTKADAWKWSSNITPLYTAPPRKEWVGLTDEEMIEIWKQHGSYETLFKKVEIKLKDKNT